MRRWLVPFALVVGLGLVIIRPEVLSVARLNWGLVQLLRQRGNEAASPNAETFDERRYVSAYMWKASLAQARGDDATACNLLTAAEALNPQNPFPHFMLGKVYLAQGDQATAVREFRRAGAGTYFLGLAGQAVADGDLRTALANYRLAVEIEPKAEAYLGLSRVLVDLQDWEAALPAISRLIELDPESAQGHVYHAIALFNLAYPDEQVMAELNKAMELDPQLVQAYTVYGQLAATRVRYAEAETWYRRAEAIDPDDPAPPLFVGINLLKQGRIQDALAQFQRVVERWPDYAAGYHMLGQAYEQMSDLAVAKTNYAVAVRLASNNAVYHLRLGVVLMQLGELSAAGAELDEAFQLDSDNAQIQAARDELAKQLSSP